MDWDKYSHVIYGDAPFIEDMGVLTTLCLLYDEVFLFGCKSLEEHLEDYKARPKSEIGDDYPCVVEQIFQVLHPEGVISFYSPSDASKRFPGSGDVEFSGIEGLETIDKDGKPCVVIKVNTKELNDLSVMVLHGMKKNTQTVSDLIRNVSLLGAAARSNTPIVCETAHIALNPSSTKVSEVATFLAHKTLRRLILPELQAYHAEDILEARLRLKGELQEFRAGILELVWLLHQCTDLSGDPRNLARECDILIDTKITSAILLLEKAISEHENKRIQRILRTMSGAILELGKALLNPSLSGVLLGTSGALLQLSDGMKSNTPNIQIASYVYKIRKKKFK